MSMPVKSEDRIPTNDIRVEVITKDDLLTIVRMHVHVLDDPPFQAVVAAAAAAVALLPDVLRERRGQSPPTVMSRGR